MHVLYTPALTAPSQNKSIRYIEGGTLPHIGPPNTGSSCTRLCVRSLCSSRPARLSGERTRRTGYPPSAEGRGAAHARTLAPRQGRTHGGRSDATPRQQTQTDTDNRAARVPSGARGFASLASCFGGEGWDVWRPALYLGLLRMCTLYYFTPVTTRQGTHEGCQYTPCFVNVQQISVIVHFLLHTRLHSARRFAPRTAHAHPHTHPRLETLLGTRAVLPGGYAQVAA